MDQNNGTFKGATCELTLDRDAHVSKLGHHDLLSIERLTTAFDVPMRVYPPAATIRPRFGLKALVFRSLRPETDFLEIKARRRADMAEQHEPEGAGGSEDAFELERVEHETGGVFGPEGATSEELEPEKSFLPEPDCYGRKTFSA